MSQRSSSRRTGGEPTARPGVRRAPLGPGVYDALERARDSLFAAAAAETPAERYVAAHVGALRIAAAVLAARAQPTKRRAPRNAWDMLTRVAPELTEWAAYFASGAPKRAAAEAGLPHAVSEREADDLLRDVELFLGVVEQTLEIPTQAA